MTSESQYGVLTLVNAPVRNCLSAPIYQLKTVGAKDFWCGELCTHGHHACAQDTAGKAGYQSHYDQPSLSHHVLAYQLAVFAEQVVPGLPGVQVQSVLIHVEM
jgi:hypothetical protein